jgi:hypothetical protein
MKTKKDYEKPLTEVVKVQNTRMLMASETVFVLSATMDGTWEEIDI